MKKLALLVGALFFVGTSFTQVTPLKNNSQTSSPPTTEKCSQHVHMAELQQQDPARYATIMQGSVEPLKIHYTAPTETEKITGLVYTIPVVFHIIHNNGVENISDAQILDQLAILNRDFRRLNADADAVASAFIGMPTDAEIEFKLATVAPNGACFNGITRTVSTLTNNGSNGQNQVNAVIAGNDVYQGVWPHNQYLNVYVAADIGGAAGYTFLPNGTSAATATNMYYNGVFILHDYCGSIGTSSTYSSRALTHEFGHWLNLPHVWGANNNPGSAGCGGTDGVQDTPDTQGSTSCTLTANTCSTDNAFWGFNQIDNVENYMDYSYCSKMYTQGQVTKMRTALTSSTGGRNNIWTTANLQAVGAMVGTSLCAVDFSATQTTMCTGTTVTYSTNSTAGISAYSWSFPGGTPATSTAASPTVTYNTAGVYNASVTLTSSANGSTYPKSKTNYITVNANTVGSLPISEGFVSTTFPPTGWTLVNPSGPAGTWARSGTVGRAPTAGNSMFFDNFNINDPSDDEVHLSKFTTTGMTSAQLVFDVAYAPYDANNYDGLQVLVSTDCGATFTSVYSKSNTVLATATATTAAFTPTAAQWRSETVSLTPFIGQSSVLVVFKNLSGYGNRLFVDNINITGVTGTVPPVASFTSGSATICAGQSITYTNTSTNSPTSYSWSFPGGTPSTSTAANPTVTYATAGTYNVSMTATNAGGSNTSTMNNYVTVNAVPTAPTISAGGPLTFCAGGSVVLTSSAGTGNTWSTSATTPSITVSTSGSYTVTRTVSGCTSPASAATTVTVNPVPSAPTISAGGPLTFCAGGSVVLTSSAGSGNTWSTGATTPSITVSSSGNYTVTTTASGCTSPASAATAVTVNPVPSAPTISAGGPLTFCAGGSVVLTSSAGSGNTWSTGATTPSITVSSSGNYTVTTTASGCTSPSSAATAVTVNPVPTAPTISAGGPLTFCTGGSVVLTSSAGSGNTWSTGATTPSITVTSSGNYTVTTTASGCTSPASAATAVTVNPIPATPTISAGGPLTFCAGGSVVLTSSAGSGNTWSTGATTPSITVTTSGNYTVTASASGCSSPSSAATAVTVNPVPTAPTISAGGPLTFCTGGSVVLTSSAGSGNTWSTGATTPSITVSTSGSYTVTTTASGCTSPASAATTVTVNTIPSAPTISAGSSTTFCSGNDVVLTSSAGSGNTWSNGATTPSITVSAAGTYTVTTTANGCTSPASSGTTITVNPTPSVTLGTVTNPAVCGANGSIAVNGSGTGDISWTGTSTGSMTGVTLPTSVSATAGTYDIVFTSAAGCASNSLNATLTDPGAPSAPTISAGGPTALCQGENVVLTSSAGSGNTWSTGETTPSITVSTAGSYTVTFTSGACTSGNSNTINVTVTTPTAASFNSIPAFCSGATAPSLPGTSTNGISGTWNPSTISNTASGSYVFTPNSGQCATGATISVTVNPAPTVSFGSVADLCVYNSAVTLTQGSPSGGTYSGPGVSGAQFDPAAAGVGNAMLTYDYTDGNGCSGSAQTVVNVDDCAGINEGELTTVLLYPNPSTGLITIDAGTAVVKAVRVFNALGQLVYEQTENLDVTNEINLPNIASGVYTVRVQTEAGTQHIPVMIQK